MTEQPANLPAVRSGQLDATGSTTVPVRDNRGIRILRLRLKGIETDYEIDFRASGTQPRGLSIIAGAFSTGKSSILEFIDYCLGAREHPRHPEVLRKVRGALLEVLLNGAPHVIERAVGESSTVAFVRTGQLDDKGISTERRPVRPPSDPTSLPSFLLSFCGLEGVELREAPTKPESKTDPLSFRDLMALCYMPNERLDDKNLLFESSFMRNLKLTQVFDVVFGIHDDKAIMLGNQVKELETRLMHARAEYAAAQAFVDEQDLGTRARAEILQNEALRSISEVESTLAAIDQSIAAASSFAESLRARHQDAAQQARNAASLVRDRETQLKRLVPLRAQYAEDVSKLNMLAEARRLFDPLRVKVCPACLSQLGRPAEIIDGHCSLCESELETESASTNGDDSHPQSESEGSHNGQQPLNLSSDVEGAFDVDSELRATKARLAELSEYIEELDAGLPRLYRDLESASQSEIEAASAVDHAANKSVTPFLSQRDDIMRQREAAITQVERARATLKMYDSVERRLTSVVRLEASISALRSELSAASKSADRSDIMAAVSARYVEILATWHYPKLDEASIQRNLVPYMRGMSYTNASSGGRTLISLAWILAIFELAWELGGNHPGFLMLDSPQKNLGYGGERDSEFADSVAVNDVYRHLHEWLAASGQGAQIIVVDNGPPPSASGDVVIRFSGRAEEPPYGLIWDETS
ncbi:hypothetical protein AAHS21_26875 [Mycobacterium sp. 050272]|uniref:hypothetical protein n=1 Tax=Mycobacterium sp. 050272 TaxID=3142488 RepID=UPI00318A4D18